MLGTRQPSRCRVEDRIFFCKSRGPTASILKIRVISWGLKSRAWKLCRRWCLGRGWGLSVWIPKAVNTTLASATAVKVNFDGAVVPVCLLIPTHSKVDLLASGRVPETGLLPACTIFSIVIPLAVPLQSTSTLFPPLIFIQDFKTLSI